MKVAILICPLCFSALSQDSVRTIAGRALQTGAYDGLALEARFNDPAAIACDPAGNIYVADSRNNAIRRIAPNGAVTTVGSAAPAFDTPSGIVISPQGLIVSDSGHHVIRRINPDGSTTIVAGMFGQSGSEDGLATAARFDTPLGLAISTNGIIYVADCGNHIVRAVSPDGAVTTIAGTAGAWGSTDGMGGTARFNGPIGLALDPGGNLFVSDSNNHTIRRISPNREVITYGGAPLENGFADGDRHAAKFFQPAELAFDSHGALYVADAMNHAIRKISANGKVTTVAGFGNRAGSTDGENQQARFYNPYGLAFLPSGELVVADAYNQTIRNSTPPAELQITLGRALTIQWNAILGRTYQLQSANPALDAWADVGNAATALTQTGSMTIQHETGFSILRLRSGP